VDAEEDGDRFSTLRSALFPGGAPDPDAGATAGGTASGEEEDEVKKREPGAAELVPRRGGPAPDDADADEVRGLGVPGDADVDVAPNVRENHVDADVAADAAALPSVVSGPGAGAPEPEGRAPGAPVDMVRVLVGGGSPSAVAQEHWRLQEQGHEHEQEQEHEHEKREKGVRRLGRGSARRDACG